MTEPTDVEIVALADETRTAEGGASGYILPISFARAVLARWGQPAHSGEPVGYLYCGGSYGDELAEWEIVADQLQCDRLNEHHGALGKEARLPLYTAPQPTQAQAGAVGKAVHQFRKKHYADWYDGFADHSDGGGPYEERTLYTAGAESAEFDQFLSDVMTAAGLVTHGKQCKALGERLADMCMKLRLHGIK